MNVTRLFSFDRGQENLIRDLVAARQASAEYFLKRADPKMSPAAVEIARRDLETAKEIVKMLNRSTM